MYIIDYLIDYLIDLIICNKEILIGICYMSFLYKFISKQINNNFSYINNNIIDKYLLHLKHREEILDTKYNEIEKYITLLKQIENINFVLLINQFNAISNNFSNLIKLTDNLTNSIDDHNKYLLNNYNSYLRTVINNSSGDLTTIIEDIFKNKISNYNELIKNMNKESLNVDNNIRSIMIKSNTIFDDINNINNKLKDINYEIQRLKLN